MSADPYQLGVWWSKGTYLRMGPHLKLTDDFCPCSLAQKRPTGAQTLLAVELDQALAADVAAVEEKA